jgi:pyridoxamine 5'-phosphate oxidase
MPPTATAWPRELLERWLEDARRAGTPDPVPVVLSTASAEAVPSARTVGLKAVTDRGLLFTTALWTRKAADISANPRASLLFHWPALGRQVHVAGLAQAATRAIAERLFSERPRAHQLQTIVSRQGTEIGDLEPLRRRLEALEREGVSAACPADWGAIEVIPEAIEFWQEAGDRLHDRRLWRREGGRWTETRLAP